MSRIVLGLGNRGHDYANTRHNLGFQVIDLVAHRLGIRFRKPLFKQYRIGGGESAGISLLLVKPLTYVNRSGSILPGIFSRTGGDAGDLIVVCDTLDLEPGQCRIRTKGSSAGHNGLKSIIHSIGTGEFTRIYVGIGRPTDKQSIPEYVLSPPEPGMETDRLEMALERSSGAVIDLLHNPPERVMNVFNGTS